MKLKKYNLQSLVPSDHQKFSKPTASSKKTTAVDVSEKHASNSQTTVNRTDTSDCKYTADKTNTGDQAAAVNVAETTSDKTTSTIDVADEAVSGDETANSDSSVAKSVEHLGTEPNSSSLCTEILPPAHVRNEGSIKTGVQKEENNEN